MRRSAWVVIFGPCASRRSCIVRNLNIVNGMPSRPERVARYRTGPGESSLIAAAMAAIERAQAPPSRAPPPARRTAASAAARAARRRPAPSPSRGGSTGAGSGATSAAVMAHDLLHRADHVVDVGVRHAGEDRQRDHPPVLLVGDRERVRREAVPLAVRRVQVERDEVDAGADVLGVERLDELGAVAGEQVQVQPQQVEVPGRLDVRPGSSASRSRASRRTPRCTARRWRSARPGSAPASSTAAAPAPPRRPSGCT